MNLLTKISDRLDKEVSKYPRLETFIQNHPIIAAYSIGAVLFVAPMIAFNYSTHPSNNVKRTVGQSILVQSFSLPEDCKNFKHGSYHGSFLDVSCLDSNGNPALYFRKVSDDHWDKIVFK